MQYTLGILIGLASGVTISGAVFAFIAGIGIVPAMAKKTSTARYIIAYEEAIIFGGIFGTLTFVWPIRLPIGAAFLAIVSVLGGMFFGVLAMSLAEVLDVMPILNRRLNLKVGLRWIVFAIVFGKLTGSLLYFLVEGFAK